MHVRRLSLWIRVELPGDEVVLRRRNFEDALALYAALDELVAEQLQDGFVES